MNEVRPYNSVASKKEQVEEMFDSIAPEYDRLNTLLSLGIHKGWRKKCIAEVVKENPENILDIATGTGELAIEAARNTRAQITGVDLSEKMLNGGRKKVQEAGLGERIGFLKGDAENLPFNEGHFDAVMAAFGVRNFGDLEKGLLEMKRVLKSGKKVYILEFSKVKNPFFKFFFHLYFRYFTPLIGRLFSKDPRAYTYLPESVEHFPSGENFLSVMRSCGYRDVNAMPLTMGVASLYTGTK